MKNTRTSTSLITFGMALLTTVATLGFSFKGERPNVVAVNGQSDWHILPPAIPSEYVTFHPDGRVTMQDMPLAGNFALTGDGVSIQGVVTTTLSADLDPTLSGPIYGPGVVTQNIGGKEKIIFKGEFFGRAYGLLATGQILFHGIGEYAGTTIALSFQETEANNEVFILTGHLMDQHKD